MKIQYQKIENGLEILRIWQDSGIIKVPEQIEGIPVIRIAPYTFSLHKDEEEKNASVYQTETGEEDDRFAQPEELCCGGMVREIHLPATVQSIGNYAFYGCMNLKLFHGTDAIVRMGSGVFTGCRLEKVEIGARCFCDSEGRFEVSDCAKLRNVRLGDGCCVNWKSFVMKNCDSIQEVSIGDGCFVNCENTVFESESSGIR